MTGGTLVLDVSNDWEAASEVQKQAMHLGPEIETLTSSARCRQLRELGGDFYDSMPLQQHRTGFAIGDASGKGLAAALMISNVQSSLRTAMLFAGNDCAKTLNAVNHQAYASSVQGRFATLFYGVIDATTGTLRYVNAGHNPPMVICRDGSTAFLEAGGAPVGIFGDWDYEEGEIQLRSGDLIVAYTDGVTEARNPSGEYWGVESLAKAATDNATESVAAIVAAIFSGMDEFSHGNQEDDATVAVLRVR
jgi:sigma-B regulation protein RsbU (phosphoserine phosphatase)